MTDLRDASIEGHAYGGARVDIHRERLRQILHAHGICSLGLSPALLRPLMAGAPWPVAGWVGFP